MEAASKCSLIVAADVSRLTVPGFYMRLERIHPALRDWYSL